MSNCSVDDCNLIFKGSSMLPECKTRDSGLDISVAGIGRSRDSINCLRIKAEKRKKQG